MADNEMPKFKTYKEDEPIPPVDPEDIKRMYEQPRVKEIGWHSEWWPGVKAAYSPGADVAAVSRRRAMISTLTIYKLLTPWQHGEELDDAVFRIAATFPLRELKHKSYMIAGDEHFGFDPNAFVQRLIEETGVSHVWEPLLTKVPEGGRHCITYEIPGLDPDIAAKRRARKVVWMIWRRFSNLADEKEKEASEIVASLFADFVIDNIDLIRQLESSFRAGDGGVDGGVDLLTELEQKAQGRT
jgi:hypothetical protein